MPMLLSSWSGSRVEAVADAMSWLAETGVRWSCAAGPSVGQYSKEDQRDVRRAFPYSRTSVTVLRRACESGLVQVKPRQHPWLPQATSSMQPNFTF